MFYGSISSPQGLSPAQKEKTMEQTKMLNASQVAKYLQMNREVKVRLREGDVVEEILKESDVMTPISQEKFKLGSGSSTKGFALSE